MTIEISKFADLQKQSSKSFHQQKSLIKRLMAGKTILCDTCGKPLILNTPEQDKKTGIYCQKGCTDIELDFD